MHAVNMFEAKSQLSRLIEAIESHQEKEIIIARHGRPAAKLVPLDTTPDTTPDTALRIGVAKHLIIPNDIDAHNDQVAKLFLEQDA